MFAALWVALAFGLVAANATFYFADEHWETGDAAANGLQIRKAKTFSEIHGNYSRFGFHHPGPGFFYAYAAGEALLHDALKVVPSPYNAHVFVGVLLQTGFLAWTLLILYRHAPHPLLVPLVLILAALHFGAVNYNIPHSMYESIWPPHVLLFPFVCFLVACASLASGSTRDLLPAVAAGSLLVHGHVAQPLFVVPLFLASCAALAWHARSAGLSLRSSLRDSSRSVIAAAVVLVIFLVPLALDATRGAQSNLAAILHEMGGGSATERKTIHQSLNYLGTLACYVPDPEKFCDQLVAGSLAYARDRWYIVVGWLLLLVALAVAYRRDSAGLGFTRSLHLFLGIAFVLMIGWGVMQSGPMYGFNSHFAHGLLFVPMILLALAVCREIDARVQARLAAFAFVIALPAFVASAHDWGIWPQVSPGPVYEEMKAAAKSEPNRKKFLRFPPGEWPWATGCALALRRLGMDYRVERRWRVIFDDAKTGSLAAALRSNEMHVWELGADPATRTGFRLLRGPHVATLPPLLDPRATELRFEGETPSAAQLAPTGWEFSGGAFAYTTARTAVLYFQPSPTERDVEITIDAFPALFPNRPAQRMVVSLERERLQEIVAESDVVARVVIPAAKWNGRRTATIVFDFPDAASPRDLGISADDRLLGFGFRSIRFSEMPLP